MGGGEQATAAEAGAAREEAEEEEEEEELDQWLHQEDADGSSAAAATTASNDTNSAEATAECLATGDDESGDDTIATRTRTKFSLVNVPIDMLESYLPDAVEPILGDEQDREYQRFLSSLLPQEQENLSFLDEEDEEYEPEDDEDDDADAAIDSAKERMTVKISKKELTELLWDSTRLGVPLLGAPSTNESGPIQNGQLFTTTGTTAAGRGDFIGGNNALFNGFNSTDSSTGLPEFMTAPSLSSSAMSMSAAATSKSQILYPPPPSMVKLPAATRFLRRGDGTQAMQDLHGTITQEQCIQLASQMHKHVQLLLQNLHLFASPPSVKTPKAVGGGKKGAGGGSDTKAKVVAAVELLSSETDNAAQKQAALQECKKMIEELQSRGEKAQQCKGALLSKLNPGASKTQQDALGSRRVTRSLTAAHAAVAHPSMFELVGSYSLEELTSKFQEECSVQDRNKTIQEQMLEIDKHLLITKKKNPKKPFTHSEDNLLAHGIKRFAYNSDSWAQIEKNFLPGKSTAVIQRRYRYLASNKTGMSAVKEYHSQFPKRRDASWILEEDLRIARGLIEFHNDNRRFARVGMNYLPHRSRLEIRKRWERIRQRFYPVIATQNAAIDDTSIDFAVLMKDLLEDKLREQVKQQSKQFIEGEASPLVGAGQQDQEEGPGVNSNNTAAQDKPGGSPSDDIEVKQEVIETMAVAGAGSGRAENRKSGQSFGNPNVCTTTKNLHPALFFTSWALINPGILLSRTCEHNWPSFIEEMSSPQQKEQAPQVEALATTVEANTLSTAEAPNATATGESSATAALAFSDVHETGIDMASLVNAFGHPDASRAMPTSKKSRQASVDYESEPSTANTSTVFEDEDENDSDYEHDELVSSEGENASDSEFEQLELSDDDEEDDNFDDDDNDFDYEELEDSGEDDEEEDDEEEAEGDDALSNGARHTATTSSKPFQAQREVSTPIVPSSSESAAQPQPQQQQQQTSPPVRHPMRLQNLQKPGNERMKRALAALERRIVGKSVHLPVGSANTVIAPAARPSGEKRRILRIALETTQSVGPACAYGSVPSPQETVGDQEEETVPDFDLEADEVLDPYSGDDSFEYEELSGGSSDDNGEDKYHSIDLTEEDDDEDEDDVQEQQHGGGTAKRQSGGVHTSANSSVRRVQVQREQHEDRESSWTPNKKIKLLAAEICQTCDRRGRCSCGGSGSTLRLALLVGDGEEAARALFLPALATFLLLLALTVIVKAIAGETERALREALQHQVVLVLGGAALRERVRQVHLAPAEQQVCDVLVGSVKLRDTAATALERHLRHHVIVEPAAAARLVQRPRLHGCDRALGGLTSRKAQKHEALGGHVLKVVMDL